ncbi:hypothetical protein CDD81_2535 [Ophiocordyceps australis]|uniref:EKC/KEOPS complex subunit GON7 n=1 Tax=Ophiocordyceps australis TaxID=1399860 RepID=A0A2C5YEY0_9HYPO|nr:hypothetical protein CDD81_2535 [Ophiocordyceps australis]
MFCYLQPGKKKRMPCLKKSRQPELTANYYTAATDESFSTKMRVPGPIPKDPMEKIRYHEQLLYNAREIQKILNEKLTEQMEKDKKRDEANTGSTSKINEEKEEINYGEDVGDQD